MPVLPKDQKMWVAYVEEIRRVSIVEKGCGEQVFKRGMKPKDPYVVFDAIEKEQYVIASADLHHTPREARIAMKKLAQEHGFEDDEDDDEDEDEDEEIEQNPIEGDEDEDDEIEDEDEDSDTEWEEDSDPNWERGDDDE